MHATKALVEADRLMTVCNSCRYCEGLCAVFPAMEMRRSFADADLNYLANLCHNCGACFVDCQFSPPHEFNVNVPQNLAEVRAQSYAAYAWPVPMPAIFARNGLVVALATALSVAVFILGFVAIADPNALYASGGEAGAFYRVMPHNVMAALFGAVFLFAMLALFMGARNFWLSTRSEGAPPLSIADVWEALRNAATLRYLDGAGADCYVEEDAGPDRRRLYHHLTFYGFMLCFAATTVATGYHYLLQREAPYPWYDLPVLLGTLGGVGLVIGPIGLRSEKSRRDPALGDPASAGMEAAFLVMLWLTGFTGLLLLLVRDTSAMGVILAAHLGVVFSLFATMPYGKFVHGIYRTLALVRFAAEKRYMDEHGVSE
jgi:citrate/tricarballylate utilization protein